MATMTSTSVQALSPFAEDVQAGLAKPGQKELSAQYFYDDLGSTLFHAITLLPEYGVGRADERLLQLHAEEIAAQLTTNCMVVELGSGNGKKTAAVLRAVKHRQRRELVYRPIDVSSAALADCEHALSDLASVKPLLGDYLDGLERASHGRKAGQQLLVMFLGSTIGNFSREQAVTFLQQVKDLLLSGDLLLLGADLVKDEQTMIVAYDDPTGVTAAFNLNLLGRINRELDADFDLSSFRHEARWNAVESRIEMHLVSLRDQSVSIHGLDLVVQFQQNESIWTESSHKFELDGLLGFARQTGFEVVQTWVDGQWPFAECLWRAV